MNKVLTTLLVMVSVNLFAQTSLKWEDPYLKSDAPGYEEVIKGYQCQSENDLKQAFEWYKKAGEKGNLWGYSSCATCLLNGQGGIKTDTMKAVQILGYCADKGYAPAQHTIAYFFYNGIGVQKDISRGAYYVTKCAEQNYMPAKQYLANCYLVGKDGIARDVEKGIKMTEECANAGDAQSQWVLGCYYSGVGGLALDYVKANKWLTMAADNGNWEACNNLAFNYAKGNGTEINFQKAHSLIQEAKFRAEHNGELNKEIEANLLDSDGEIYMMEAKNDEVAAIWQQMKEKYPDYVEANKFNVGNVFVRTMYKKEQETDKSSVVANSNIKSAKSIIISDIDENIPENAVVGNPTFAVIIANENYKDVEEVPYANHDGEIFKQYCEKTLGIPKSNIKYVADATLNNIRRELKWLNQVMDVYQGEANIIFYYAGHGIPDERNGSAYILPVDGIGNDVSTGYSLDQLYSDLSSKPANSVIVLLDACFSGSKRDGRMLTSARGVAIRVKQNSPKGKMVVLSAAQGDETAYPYKEKGHGMFTYYLLKKLQNSKGDVTIGDLSDYVVGEVKKQSLVINGKIQTPQIAPSSTATDWRDWTFR